MNLRRWLTPGIGVKRWLVVVFLGMLLLALGLAHMLRQLSQDLQPGGFAGTVLDIATLQFLPYVARGIVVAGLGTVLIVVGSVRVLRTLTALPHGRSRRPAAGRGPVSDAGPGARTADRGHRWRDRPVRCCCVASRSTRAT